MNVILLYLLLALLVNGIHIKNFDQHHPLVKRDRVNRPYAQRGYNKRKLRHPDIVVKREDPDTATPAEFDTEDSTVETDELKRCMAMHGGMKVFPHPIQPCNKCWCTSKGAVKCTKKYCSKLNIAELTQYPT